MPLIKKPRVDTLSSTRFFNTQKKTRQWIANYLVTLIFRGSFNFLKFHIKSITFSRASVQKVYISQISRRYGVKPVAHQFFPQQNLFLLTFRLPTLIMPESRRPWGRLTVVSNLKTFIDRTIFQSDVCNKI